ncbi:mucin-19-like isoform X2 [Nylanderia fulva]|uniref:mucin-19-like isoform X2 n=1 Tax=Nylanderia fulva TaxID=613905 RepID=UPI0010FB8F2B|nr:mucin-19-like isoform X2 [Nylanderia fulva]
MTEMRTGCLRCLRSLTVTLVVCSLFIESGSHALGAGNGAFAAYAGTGASASSSNVGASKGAAESSGAYDRHIGIRSYSPSGRIIQDKDIDSDAKSYGVVPEPGASRDGIKGSNHGYNKPSCSKCKWENDDYWEHDEPEEEGDENDGRECDDGQYRPYGLRHREREPGLSGAHKIGPTNVYANDEPADLAQPTAAYTTPTNFAAKAYTALKPEHLDATAGGLAGATVYVHPEHGVSSNSLPDWNERTTPTEFESTTKPWDGSRNFVTTRRPGTTSWSIGVHPASRKPWNNGYDINAPAASTTRPGQGWSTTHPGFTAGTFTVTKPEWNTELNSTSGLQHSRKSWNSGAKPVETSGCSPFDPTCIQGKQHLFKLAATPGYIEKTKDDEYPDDVSSIPQTGSAVSSASPHINYGSPNKNHNWHYNHHATQSSSAHSGASATSSASHHHVGTYNFGKDNPFLNKPASTPYSGLDQAYNPRNFPDSNIPGRDRPLTVAHTFGTTAAGSYGGIGSSSHHATQSSSAHSGASATSSASHHHAGTYNFGKKDNPFLNKPASTPYSGIDQGYDPRSFSDYNPPGRVSTRPSTVTHTFGTTVGPYGGISSSGHHATQSSNAHSAHSAGSSTTSSASHHHIGVQNFGKKDNPFFNQPASTATPNFSDFNTPERERPSTLTHTFGTTIGPYGGISSSGHHATQSSSAHSGTSATSSAAHHHVGVHKFGKDNPFFNKPTSTQTPYFGIHQALDPNSYDPNSSNYNTPRYEKPIATHTFGTTVGPYGGISSSGHHATQSSSAHTGTSATSSAAHHHVGVHKFGKDNPFLNKPASTQTPYIGIHQALDPNSYDPNSSGYNTPRYEKPIATHTFGTTVGPYGGISSSGHHATQSSSAHTGTSATSSAAHHHVGVHKFGKDNPFLNKPASTQTPYIGIHQALDPNSYDPNSSGYNTPRYEKPIGTHTFGTTVGPYGGISSSGHHATQSSSAHTGTSATSSAAHHHVGVHKFGKDNPFLNKPASTQTPYIGMHHALDSNSYDPSSSGYNTPRYEKPIATHTFGTTVGPYGGISSFGHHATQSSSSTHNAHSAGTSATSSTSHHHVGVHNYGKKDNPFFNKPGSTETPFSDFNTPERERPSTVANTFGTTVAPYGGISSPGHHATQSATSHAGSSATSSASHHVGTHNFGKKTSLQTPYSGTYPLHPNAYDLRLYGGNSPSSIVPGIQGNTLSPGKFPEFPTGSGIYHHPSVTKPSYGSGITTTSSWLHTGHPASGSSTWHGLGTHTGAHTGTYAGAHAGLPASTTRFGTTKSPFGYTNIPDPSLGSSHGGTELKHDFHSTSSSASASSSAHGHHNTHGIHVIGTTPIYQGTSSYPGVKGASKGTTGPAYGSVPPFTHSDAGTGSKTWPDKQPGSSTWPGRHPGFGVFSTVHPGSGSGTWPSKKPEDGSGTRPGIFGDAADPHEENGKGNCTGKPCNGTLSGHPSGVIKTLYPIGSGDGHVSHVGSAHGSGSLFHTTRVYPGTHAGCPSGDPSCNQGVTPEGSVHWNPSNPFLFGGSTPSHTSSPWNSGTTAKPIGGGNPFLDPSWNRPKPDYNNNNNANDQNVIPHGEGSTKPIGQGNPFLDGSKRRGDSKPQGQNPGGFGDYPGTGIGQFNVAHHPAFTGSHLPGSLGVHAQASSFAHVKPLHFPDVPEYGENHFNHDQHNSNSWSSSSASSSSSSGSHHHYWADQHPTEPPSVYIKG